MEIAVEKNSSKQLNDLHGFTQLSESELETWMFIPGSASYLLPPRIHSVRATYGEDYIGIPCSWAYYIIRVCSQTVLERNFKKHLLEEKKF